MKKYKSFKEYLSEKHGEQYTGLDDEMPDDFENWLTELDITDVINWADQHAKETSEIAINNAFERFQQLQKEGVV